MKPKKQKRVYKYKVGQQVVDRETHRFAIICARTHYEDMNLPGGAILEASDNVYIVQIGSDDGLEIRVEEYLKPDPSANTAQKS